MKDLIKDERAEEKKLLPTDLGETITCEQLHDAYFKLTKRQQTILSLAFIHQLRDTEIAKQLNISQQAVTKSRRNAIKKLKEYIINSGDNNG